MVTMRQHDFLLAPGLELKSAATRSSSRSRAARWAPSTGRADAERAAEVARQAAHRRRHAARFEIEARLLSSSWPPAGRAGDRLLPGRDRPVPRDGARRGHRPRRGAQAARATRACRVDNAIEYVRQACEALQYVHEQQIVHRDVKPQNLILGEDGSCSSTSASRASWTRRTTGTVGIGTPRFMAPEVFAGGAVSPRSDVFGLAATAVDAARRASRPSTPTRRSSPSIVPERAARARGDDQGRARDDPRAPGGVRQRPSPQALGAPLVRDSGESLAISVERPDAPRHLMEGIVRDGGRRLRGRRGVDRARSTGRRASSSTSPPGEPARTRSSASGCRPGKGIARIVVASGEAEAVATAASDPRFAAQIAAGTGYVPYTMLVVPAQARAASRSASCRCSTAATAASTARRTWSARRCSPSWPSPRSTCEPERRASSSLGDAALILG